MKKNSFLALFCCALIVFGTVCDAQSELDLIRKYKIKKRTSSDKEQIYYNVNSKDSLLFKEGTKFSWYTYTYDEQHRISERKEFKGEDNKLRSKETYTYKEDGSFKTEHLYYGKYGVIQTNYGYNKKEQMINYSFPKLEYSAEYSYDEQGNINKQIIHEGMKTTTSDVINKYNKMNQRIESTNDNSKTKSIYKYDKRGFITERQDTDKDGKVSVVTFVYE